MEPFQKAGHIQRYKRRLNMETAYSNLNEKIWLFFDVVVECELVMETAQQRLELWDNLYYMKRDMELPWLVGGDFNVVLHEDEKIGGFPVHPPEYEGFAFCVNSCGLFYQGYKGSPFTWWNGRSNAECIFKRLDRIFVNFPFQNMMPTIEVEHLIRTRSDHALLLMTCGEQAINFVKPFRFLKFWTKHATFMEVVRQNWNADFIGDPFLMLKHKLKKVKVELSKWSRDTFGNIFKQLAILEDIVRKAQSELKKYLSIEEQYWKQKTGMIWFAEGDRNTSFFNNHDNGKRKKLQLKRIQNGDGAWLEDQEQMANATIDFYQIQFTKEGDPADFPMLDNVPEMPKKPRVQTFSDLKPISLSNFINKVISRVIHYKLEKFLPRYISPNQSGFVKGRSIFENILLTQEIVTEIRMRVLVNGQASRFFKSTRGVKKGDPLYPALFILSTEVLSRSLNKLFEDKSFIGFGMPKWSNPLNQLAYADDTIIFASAHPPSSSKIMAVLGGYE
uniref:Reverse transcriptase domain-containing protein n=1 Tax=Nicotiana tabacum TaxID=4097 RepID=A0A1S3Z641_TOBAC|nr:PREDICTED: uncharacterized protein LOC107783415 [Nicotiana tabacum]